MKQLNIWKTSFYTMLAIAAGAFTACVDDDVDKQAPTLELSEEAVAFTGTATEDATVTVRSNRQWTVAYEDEETQKEWMYFKVSGNEVSEGIYNGDGTVKNPGDMRVIGNSLPRYTYSIRGDLNWNGFDFAVFFQGVGKIDWMPSANCYYFWGPYSFPTTTFIAKDFERLAWSEDNRNTYFPRRRSYQTSSAGSMKVKTDRYLQDASYIRLKNITLGYTIPINKRILEKVRVYVSGENLAYWSPLKRYSKTVDPEVATTSATNDCLYPYSRTFSVGVDITF